MVKARYQVFGVTGGIGSGKSVFSKVAQDLGYPVVDADQVARRVVEPGQPGWQALSQAFGPNIFFEDGQLNRAALRSLIADNPKKQQQLNALLHPIIGQEITRVTHELGTKHPHIFVEAALMMESGSYQRYDKVVLITAPTSVRLSRVVARDQKTAQETRAIMALQWPDHQKAKLADLVLKNDTDLTTFKIQCKEAIQRLTSQQLEKNTEFDLY